MRYAFPYLIVYLLASSTGQPTGFTAVRIGFCCEAEVRAHRCMMPMTIAGAVMSLPRHNDKIISAETPAAMNAAAEYLLDQANRICRNPA